ncbi:MAG: hypothetical protein Hyperionvirus10_13 [Hyperionvirus sp.]|uniref:RING-type domain-containing protein n=1 Tax=Hyperionvirus sp. TaxID=2487770 RepID=A0A3G5A8U0_9VIRU|nr:MAG: hypothetical protein Hyperionvirus10_13 [Hyperionvirus sp.]
MGNSISETDNTNFRTLLTALQKLRIGEIKLVIENGERFNFHYGDVTFFHYLVVYAITYSRGDVEQVCDIIYGHYQKFFSPKEKSVGYNYIQLKFDETRMVHSAWKKTDREKIKTEVTDEWDFFGPGIRVRDFWRTYPNLYDFTNLDAVSFCLKIKNEFVLKNKLEDNLDVVIDLFNKISNTIKTNPMICVVCKKNKRNILIKDCKHVCMCQQCLKGATLCPVCKKGIESSEEIIL